jgi:protein-tyrosine phosphatase
VSTLLVICEGNICRSPMGEGLARAQLRGWNVASAGLNALVGAPADSTAVALMRGRGVDIEDHRARQITRKMCVDADLVLVMDGEQRRRLQDMYPEVCGRVFRIGDHMDRDVPDPFRRPEDAFLEALALIEQGVSRWVQRIQRL